MTGPEILYRGAFTLFELSREYFFLDFPIMFASIPFLL